jgi:hypothetical protein
MLMIPYAVELLAGEVLRDRSNAKAMPRRRRGWKRWSTGLLIGNKGSNYSGLFMLNKHRIHRSLGVLKKIARYVITHFARLVTRIDRTQICS